MTPEQVTMVQESFRKVVPIAGTAADLFYGRLFEIAPEVRPLFPEDLSEQKKKLIGMLATAVANLHQADKIMTAVQDLGGATSPTALPPNSTSRSARRCSGPWSRASATSSHRH